jgi:uroporphyrin-III C-methyltransferase / precorrin-2 dehydrogenase / sirohydrochlorin ferrochelatase
VNAVYSRDRSNQTGRSRPYLAYAAVDFLPVFLNLRERAVLVVGGGEVACRKIELLLQAGARVTVVAPDLHTELRALQAEGILRWINARFEPSMLDGQCFAIAATGDAHVNLAVTQAGTLTTVRHQPV